MKMIKTRHMSKKTQSIGFDLPHTTFGIFTSFGFLMYLYTSFIFHLAVFLFCQFLYVDPERCNI